MPQPPVHTNSSTAVLVACLVFFLVFLVVRQEPKVRLFVSERTAADIAHDEGDTLWLLWGRVLREAGRPGPTDRPSRWGRTQ